MSQLTPRERALVSLGAAIGSNCISCIEYHIPASRTAGLTDAQISEAIHAADKLRQVPARKVLDAAINLLPECAAPESVEAGGPGKPCCSSPDHAADSKMDGGAGSAANRSVSPTTSGRNTRRRSAA